MRRAGRIVAATIAAVLDAVRTGAPRATSTRWPSPSSVSKGQRPRSRGTGVPTRHDLCLDRRGDRATASLRPAAGSRRGIGSRSTSAQSGKGPRRLGRDRVVGGYRRRRKEAARLVKTTEERGGAGCGHRGGAARLEQVLSDNIGHEIESVATRAGLGIVLGYGGHGIGRALHEDPFIQNYGRPGRGPDLRPGLVIAIEPMLMLGEEDQGARR